MSLQIDDSVIMATHDNLPAILPVLTSDMTL